MTPSEFRAARDGLGLTPSEFRAARDGLGLTQAAFARLLGVTRQRVNDYERGRRPIREQLARHVRLLTAPGLPM